MFYFSYILIFSRYIHNFQFSFIYTFSYVRFGWSAGNLLIRKGVWEMSYGKIWGMLWVFTILEFFFCLHFSFLIFLVILILVKSELFLGKFTNKIKKQKKSLQMRYVCNVMYKLLIEQCKETKGKAINSIILNGKLQMENAIFTRLKEWQTGNSRNKI